MASSSAITQALEMDVWTKVTWEEFLAFADDSTWEKGKFYYYEQHMRVEMSPVGPLHSRHNSVVSRVVNFYTAFRNIRIVELINASFHKTGLREFQPDLSYYIGEDFELPPRTNTPINLNGFAPPALVVEIGASCSTDDLGVNRLIYEHSEVQEYWAANANTNAVFAFAITTGGSGTIQNSRVLPGLEIALVEEALNRSQTEDDGEINRWLIQTFSQG